MLLFRKENYSILFCDIIFWWHNSSQIYHNSVANLQWNISSANFHCKITKSLYNDCPMPVRCKSIAIYLSHLSLYYFAMEIGVVSNPLQLCCKIDCKYVSNYFYYFSETFFSDTISITNFLFRRKAVTNRLQIGNRFITMQMSVAKS